MAFNSTEFVFFFLAVFYVHWAIARWTTARYVWLFAMSCVFYMSWNAKFIGLILGSTFVDYVCGLAIARTEDPKKRKAWLLVSILTTFGLLGFFKYFNFFAENVASGLARAGFEGAAHWVPWNIVLPAGISFHTFQGLSYTIDVYRRQLEPVRSPLRYMLFISFFPQLVAGPIVRATDFLPQLENPRPYVESKAARGVFLMLCGLAKKVLLADTIGLELVDPVFAQPEKFGALGILLGTWGALFQFYLDFSAYSDIAIGAAATLGFDLPINFDRPFLAQSIPEFWRRWHISLSTWFRDYVFLPLGGRGKNRLEFLRNILGTMFLTGLWHGAGWNYLIWGSMHGVFTFASTTFRKQRTKEELAARPTWERALRRAWVFNLVALSMLFFRNGTVLEGNHGLEGSLGMLATFGSFAPMSASLSAIGVVALAIAALIHFTPKEWIHERARDAWIRLPAPAQACGLTVATGTLAAMSYAKAPFIYFQF